MFTPHTENDYTQSLPGITQKTLVFGDKTLMVEFVLAKGSALPLQPIRDTLIPPARP